MNRPVPSGYKLKINDAAPSLKGIEPLTTLERSYVQTFPVGYNWGNINKTSMEQLIGNAVPVNLAEFVAKALKKHMCLVKRSK